MGSHPVAMFCCVILGKSELSQSVWPHMWSRTTNTHTHTHTHTELNVHLFIWLCWVLVAACGIYFPDQGWNLGSLHWKHSLSHWTIRTSVSEQLYYMTALRIKWDDRSDILFILIMQVLFLQGLLSRSLSQEKRNSVLSTPILNKIFKDKVISSSLFRCPTTMHELCFHLLFNLRTEQTKVSEFCPW